MRKKRYNVTITETLEMEVKVDAKSREEAENLVRREWGRSEYILDADCFKGVEFSAEESLRESEKSVRNRKDYSR